MTALKLHTGNRLDIYSADTKSKLDLPVVDEGISAGFPSPALDFMDTTIDLNRELVSNPSATFYGKVKGLSLKDAGIDDGDLLVIDKSLEPAHGKIAVCFIDGEFTAKRLKVENDQVWLMPENKDYKPIKIKDEDNFLIWGVVTYVIKRF